jgi:tRNA(fMet)-specific endonuclease VapC
LTMPLALLDTDTLSEIIKGRNASVSARAAQYLAQYGSFTFSLITRFEILRGLKAKTATAQLTAFEARCRVSSVLPITDAIIVQAADHYADLKRRGGLIGDADLIIAATAIIHGLVLVTTNTAHYRRIAGLVLDRWTQP